MIKTQMIRYTDLVEDTICAQITPPGFGGVSVVRISGPLARKLMASFIGLEKALKTESHQAILSVLKNPVSNAVIDEALVTFFEEGKSFTGDESVEVSLHGNPNIVKAFLEGLHELGCRLAEKGEFSFRAFYNGRLDLTQAEAIHTLIGSETIPQAQEALGHLGGQFKDELLLIEKDIIDVLTQIEAAIDFSERDIVTESSAIYVEKIRDIVDAVETKRNHFKRSKNLVAQKQIIIAGPPNVGKSSLFNCLVNDDRAIVSNIPGTTRDLVQEELVLGEASIKIHDTAGLRETADPIEEMGIKKSFSSISKADLVVWVNDSTQDLPQAPLELRDKPVLLVLNKVDQLGGTNRQVLDSKALGLDVVAVVWVSATDGTGLVELNKTLSRWLKECQSSESDVGLNNSRQYTLLLNIGAEVQMGLEKAQSDQEMDLCAFHLNIALDSVQNLLGKQFNDEVLDNIFSGFCLGK